MITLAVLLRSAVRVRPMIAEKLPRDHDRTTYYKAQSSTGGKARHHPVDDISRKRDGLWRYAEGTRAVNNY